jgi:hypothetical protein
VSDEIPREIPPLSPAEQTIAERLTAADLEIIDATIMANCSARWLKVARIVSYTEETLRARYPGLSYIFYTERLSWLVEQGRLESKGDVFYVRFSEVRLPN